ncbi:hypothetical protein BTVI_45260 [Pitangus sulphuratus]|nr:hypothetical protein BTVI_45260 [Pitangus sulphuratus]
MLEQALAEARAVQKLKQALLSAVEVPKAPAAKESCVSVTPVLKAVTEVPNAPVTPVLKAAAEAQNVPAATALKATAKAPNVSVTAVLKAEVLKAAAAGSEAATKDRKVPITSFPLEETNFWSSSLVVPSAPLTPAEQVSGFFPIPPYESFKKPENVPLPNDDSDTEIDNPGSVQPETATAQDQLHPGPIMQEVQKQSKYFEDLLGEMRQIDTSAANNKKIQRMYDKAARTIKESLDYLAESATVETKIEPLQPEPIQQSFSKTCKDKRTDDIAKIRRTLR